MEQITITTEFIKLDAFLKFAALVGTGGDGDRVDFQGAVFEVVRG